MRPRAEMRLKRTRTLIESAKSEGYTDADIEPFKDALSGMISQRFESNTDAEVRRLAAKDD